MPIVLSRKTGLRLKPCSRPQQHNPKTNRCKKLSAKKSSPRKSGKKSSCKSGKKSAKKSSRKSVKKSARKLASKSTAMVLYKRH